MLPLNMLNDTLSIWISLPTCILVHSYLFVDTCTIFWRQRTAIDITYCYISDETMVRDSADHACLVVGALQFLSVIELQRPHTIVVSLENIVLQCTLDRNRPTRCSFRSFEDDVNCLHGSGRHRPFANPKKMVNQNAATSWSVILCIRRCISSLIAWYI